MSRVTSFRELPWRHALAPWVGAETQAGEVVATGTHRDESNTLRRDGLANR